MPVMSDPQYRDLIPYDTETGQGDIWQKGDEIVGGISGKWVPVNRIDYGKPFRCIDGRKGRRPLKLLQEEKKHLPFISGGATIRKLHHEIADLKAQVSQLIKERDAALEAHEGERLAKEELLATVKQLTRAIHQIIKLSAMGSRDEIWRIATEAITSAKETP